MTKVEPQRNENAGEKLKDGMNHETALEITIESDVANPFTTLSAYFITRATSRPPRETWKSSKGIADMGSKLSCGGILSCIAHVPERALA